MKKYITLALMLFATISVISCGDSPRIPRGIFDWEALPTMASARYLDQPYMSLLPNGEIVCVITYNDAQKEGSARQRIGLIRSSDNGATWSDVSDIESPLEPESSWGIPYFDSSTGTLYVFYTFNFEDVRYIPNNDGTGRKERVDIIGTIAWRASSDLGHTWGPRNLLNLPLANIDFRNPFGGTKQMLWTTGIAKSDGTHVYFGFSKIGEVWGEELFRDTESFLLKIDLSTMAVSQYPSGDGIRIPNTKIGEEPNFTIHADGVITAVFRTTTGHLGEAWSTDGGQTFSVDYALHDTGSAVKQPRAIGQTAELPDGRMFLWFHNNDNTWYKNRNPVYYAIGTRQGNRISWGTSKVLVSSPLNPNIGITYPSMLIVGDELLIAATDKSNAKFMKIKLSEL